MQAVETVTVYSFRVYGMEPEGYQIAPFKAPREVIERDYGGEVLPGTALEIEPESLDGQGRYRRIATGWGAFD